MQAELKSSKDLKSAEFNGELVSFFSLQENREVISHAYAQLEAAAKSVRQMQYSQKNIFVIEFLRAFLNRVMQAPSVFDMHCKFNIEHIGNQFLRRFASLNLTQEAEIDEIVSLAYRFTLELQLVSPGALGEDLDRCVQVLHEHKFSASAQSQLKYAEHQMILSVVTSYLHHPGMVDLRQLPAAIERSEKERLLSEQMLEEQNVRVSALREALEKYEAAFNFVGLYDGFKKLRAQKISEGRLGLAWLCVLGMLMLSPFAAKFAFVLFPPADIKLDVYTYLSVLGFEFVLAYFFRVGLHGYRAVKAQLIQIDLRMALCQFIQNYAAYAKDVRKDSPELLDRFDQLIFSGIVNSESAIPSTFDGLDQVANVLDKLKGK